MKTENSIPGILKIFISYTQESGQHSARALALSNALREAGFDCDIDQYHVNQRWPTWMEERIEWADNVLVICTQTYLRRWKGEEKDGVGLGAQWESLLTKQYLYESPKRNDKFVPVVFEQADLAFIPKPLADVTHILVGPNLEKLERLKSRLLGVPVAEMPPIRTSLAPVQAAQGFFGTTSPHPEPLSVGLRDELESLSSNLFPLSFPKTIYFAKLGGKRRGQKDFLKRVELAWQKSKEKGRAPTDFLIDQGKLYTFQGLTSPLWKDLIVNRALVETGSFPSSKWAESKVLAESSLFIKLLNRNLRHLCENIGCEFRIEYSKDLRCHLFAVKGQIREGRIKAFALKASASRTVYKAIRDENSSDPKAIQHWKHEAFRHKFQRFDKTWYFILTPFWAFTSDGVSTPSKWHKRSSANMRKPERNRAVLGHVLFWAHILCSKDGDLLASGEGFRINRPFGLSLSPSIKDTDWVKAAKPDEKKEVQADMGILL